MHKAPPKNTAHDGLEAYIGKAVAVAVVPMMMPMIYMSSATLIEKKYYGIAQSYDEAFLYLLESNGETILLRIKEVRAIRLLNMTEPQNTLLRPADKPESDTLLRPVKPDRLGKHKHLLRPADIPDKLDGK